VLTTTLSLLYTYVMTTKFIALISVIGLVNICLVQGQSPTPGESPAVSPSPAESPAASPSPAESPTATPKEKPTPKEAKPKKTASPAASPAPATRGGPGMVWVSTDSRVYYKEGSRFYGKTKNGKYMSEADAIKEGNRPAAQDY
jgi:hypothetical protein